jgi:hypothetical protein
MHFAATEKFLTPHTWGGDDGSNYDAPPVPRNEYAAPQRSELEPEAVKAGSEPVGTVHPWVDMHFAATEKFLTPHTWGGDDGSNYDAPPVPRNEYAAPQRSELEPESQSHQHPATEPEPEPEPVPVPQPKPTPALQEPPPDVVVAKIFSAKLGKQKVKVTVDGLGLYVVQDTKRADKVGSYSLKEISGWKVVSSGRKSTALKVFFNKENGEVGARTSDTGGKKKGKGSGKKEQSAQGPIQFDLKDAQTMSIALQGAKMARLAWFEMQKLSEDEKTAAVDFLSRAPLLKVLSLEERTKLAAYTTKHTYAKGEVIIEQGGAADGAFIVASGSAKAEIDGVTVRSNYAAGDFFGELALIHDTPRTASVRATKSGTSCFKISKREFELVMGLNGEMLQARQRQYAVLIIEHHWTRTMEMRRLAISVEEGVPPRCAAHQSSVASVDGDESVVDAEAALAAFRVGMSADLTTVTHETGLLREEFRSDVGDFRRTTRELKASLGILAERRD